MSNTIPMSVLIQQEIDRRKALRAMQKARLRLVWVAPAQEREKGEGLKNVEEK